MQFFAGCLQITSLSPAEIDEFGHAECELAYLTQGFGYWLCTVQAVSMGLWPKRCISRYLVSWCYFGPQLFGNRRNHLPMKMNNEQGAEKKMGTTRKQMCGCVPLQFHRVLRPARYFGLLRRPTLQCGFSNILITYFAHASASLPPQSKQTPPLVFGQKAAARRSPCWLLATCGDALHHVPSRRLHTTALFAQTPAQSLAPSGRSLRTASSCSASADSLHHVPSRTQSTTASCVHRPPSRRSALSGRSPRTWV